MLYWQKKKSDTYRRVHSDATSRGLAVDNQKLTESSKEKLSLKNKIREKDMNMNSSEVSSK